MGSLRPWSALAPTLAEALRMDLPSTIDATVAAIAIEVPAYSRMTGRMGAVVVGGVDTALNRLLDLLGSDDPALDPAAARVYRRIGAGERAAGRSLESVLAAYRTGARVAWERMSSTATQSGIDVHELVSLAEAIFVYIDELSAESAAGYASEQAAQAGHRDVTRSRLAEALLDGVALTDPGRVRALADEAGWELPATLAVALLPGVAGSGRPIPTAPVEVLVVERGTDVLAVLPNPDRPGQRRALTPGLTSGPVYVGSVRPPGEAAASLAHARRLHWLVEAGMIAPSQVSIANDHLVELVVGADPGLLDTLAGHALQPLAGMRGERRRTLEVTLASWLAHDGDRAATAEELQVHPQTVSYRMGRLRDLFGSALTDPDSRLELQLALLGRRTRGADA